MGCRKLYRGNLCSPEAWKNVYVWKIQEPAWSHLIDFLKMRIMKKKIVPLSELWQCKAVHILMAKLVPAQFNFPKIFQRTSLRGSVHRSKVTRNGRRMDWLIGNAFRWWTTRCTHCHWPAWPCFVFGTNWEPKLQSVTLAPPRNHLHPKVKSQPYPIAQNLTRIR